MFLALLIAWTLAAAVELPFHPEELAVLDAEARAKVLQLAVEETDDPDQAARYRAALAVSTALRDAPPEEVYSALSATLAAEVRAAEPEHRGEVAVEEPRVAMSIPRGPLVLERGELADVRFPGPILLAALAQGPEYIVVYEIPDPSDRNTGWVVMGKGGDRLDALDVARLIGDRRAEERVRKRRRQVYGAGLVGATVGSWISIGASHLVWQRQRYQLDRYFNRQRLVRQLESQGVDVPPH